MEAIVSDQLGRVRQEKGDTAMRKRTQLALGLVACLVVGMMAAELVMANGGPFVIKYPNGDPAAKGVLARLGENLKPGRIKGLRVVEEDLTVVFHHNPMTWGGKTDSPLASVSAAYTIENPTGRDVEIDFGFPILRGIHIPAFSMSPQPDVRVRMNDKHIQSHIISNSTIYGIIRRRAREAIETGIFGAASQQQAHKAATKKATGRAKLAALVTAVRSASGDERLRVRRALADYLTGQLNWNNRDAALLVEYAGLDFGKMKSRPVDRTMRSFGRGSKDDPKNENLGPLSAIGEQKATQFFAQLASKFDSQAAAAYEAIFSAWGGDVRERSVDLTSGKVRPREITVEGMPNSSLRAVVDPTVYARIDYLDPKAKITEAEKASCRTVLKNLRVVFTFAPMNLIHYQVNFAKAAEADTKPYNLTVSYSQHAYRDTRSPESYQLAYVLHPASMWDEFGPIKVKVYAPEGVPVVASVPLTKAGLVEKKLIPKIHRRFGTSKDYRYRIYEATLTQKTGELFIAVDAKAWKKVHAKTDAQTAKGNKK